MLFKDIKPGTSLYMFDRDQVKMQELKVTNVAPPKYESGKAYSSMDLMVDIETNNSKIYTFKADSETGYPTPNIVISPNLDYVLKSVEDMCLQSEQAWNHRDTYKANMDKCNEILANYSPIFKAKKENEERFSNLENSVTELKEMLKDLVKELKS